MQKQACIFKHHVQKKIQANLENTKHDVQMMLMGLISNFFVFIKIQQEMHREASVRSRLEKDTEALRQEKSRLNGELHVSTIFRIFYIFEKLK